MVNNCLNKPTSRELDVIKLLSEGYSNKGIAKHLGISIRTVEAHLQTAYRKLGALERADAPLKAVKAGWIIL